MSDEAAMSAASQVNRQVNGAIRQVDDAINHGVAELWTLPVNGKGDCEDIALLKKRELIGMGVAPNRLLMAVVLDRRGNNHAILLLRLAAADMALDSLTGRIVPWNRTGYTFLAAQKADDTSRWGALYGPELVLR